MREGAHRDEVDARLGRRASGHRRHAARGLRRDLGARRLVEELHVDDRFRHRGGRHVVEQNAFGAGVERLVHFVEGARLGLHEEPAQAAVQRAEVGRASRRFPRAAGAVGVVVFHEEAAREAGSVIRAAAATYRVPLEGAEAGRRLARVEEDGPGPLQRLHVCMRHGRDSGEPLHEVERGALDGQNGDGGSLDLGEDGPTLHEVAVGDRERDAGRRGEKGEEPGQERRSGDHGALAADHLRGDAGGRSEDGQRRDVLAVFGEGARQQVVEVGGEGGLRQLHLELTEYLTRAKAPKTEIRAHNRTFAHLLEEDFVKTRLSLVLALALLPAAARAEEGMWMPQQIPQLAERLKTMGFRGDPQAFADLTGQPMGAIVSLGGCSASFVSPDGLIVTNHHCVQGALQFNSTPQKNLLEDGFLASSRDQELTAGPGSRVYVTTSVKEVTAEITGRLDPKLADRDRHEVIEKRLKERTAACEKDGLRCRVASFFDGLKYFELAQLEIQDVRLVYAPAAGIGNFGGETDNWQWPRHTGDWSFYRAYVSPTGKSVTYAKENVPFKPKHWLKVSPEGAGPGDLVFVAGYPGRTQRFATYAQTQELAEWSFPRTVRRNTELIALLDEVGKKSKETEIRVTTRKRGLNNTLTNRKGVVEGFKKGNLLAKKEGMEKDLATWIAADPNRQKSYGDVLPALNVLSAERLKTRERDTEYQERNWSRIREGQERLQRSYDPVADRALLRYILMEASKLPGGQRIEALDKEAGFSTGMSDAGAGKKIDALLDRLYAGTKLGDKAARLALFDKSTAEILAPKDPMLSLAVVLDPLWQANRERAKTRDGAHERLGARYAQAVLEKSGGLTAPDANGTLRVTYGRVLGVPARDGLIYFPQTTLQGVVEKATGTGEFNAPKKELDAIAAMKAGKKTAYADPKLGSVPVNFLSTVDTTGGNSGSATLNAKGELCGLLFDGTFDTVASDYLYDTEKTRSIHVDSRYMLWTMSEVDGAANLLKEIGEAPSLDVTAAH